ncbi:lysylphosphatidylglycerol synthase domain-containing protein [Nocardia gipuzkoensis]|uniref:lysylphosphatidylglycerol synthase domain-containing protein n=1 Tax=Nocardia gipuzkoensis TaxID=2749991 RepID=UPI001E4E1890|nr:lysylphosphatidylglycerol synthase domain-containing protein [Nocardia gipuzkoensis]UGT67800.1 lysylphosphatidylglycerol synthase domain-containing protein [Nocardia gipuzkoensis]
MTIETVRDSTPVTSTADDKAYPLVLTRHAGDVVRLVLGLVTLGVSALLARRTEVPRLEVDLFRVINDLPSWVAPVVLVVMQLGAIGAVGVVAGLALVTRRFKLARDVAAAGVLAYVLAVEVKSLVGRARPDVLLQELILRTHQGGLGFVSGHAAVAAAMAAAAAPWLPRPWRRIAWATAGVVAASRVFVGAHLVLDVVGGAALGWTIAAALHLIWGAPVHRAEAPVLREALAATGWNPIRVQPAVLDARGSRPFLVTADISGQTTELFVKVIGYHERNSDLLFKLFRHIIYREIEDESPFATPKQEAEHEAFIALLAQRAGVRTPTVVSVGVASNGDAWIAETRIPGRDLARCSGSISDEVLCEVWSQIARLRAARIAHRDLRLANILLDEHATPWIVDFGFGESAASDHRLDADVAEMLVSMSLKVGTERAVATAQEILGPDALKGAAPLLQPLALASATRSAARHRHGLLDELRTAVGDAIDADPARPEVLLRFRWRTLGWIAATVFATYVLLPQIGQLGQLVATLDDAQWQWLAGALAMSLTTYAAASLTFMGASPRALAFGRTMIVQLATSFANRLAPYGLGGAAVNERYLESCGLPRTTAIAVIGLTVTSGALLHVLELAGVGVWLGSTRILLSSALPSRWSVLIGFIAVMTALGTAIAVLLRRPDWLTQIRSTARSITDVLRTPKRAALLLGGQVGANIGYIAALGFAVCAFGGSPSAALVAAVFLGGQALGAASPTPSGLGVVEASLVAGLMVGGVASAPAVAGVLAYRIATFWLPAAAGFFAFRFLQRHHIL